MNGTDFKWSSLVLAEVAQMALKRPLATGIQPLEYDNVSIPVRRIRMPTPEHPAFAHVQKWINSLFQAPFRSTMIYEGNKNDDELKDNKKKWLDFWKNLATKLKTSFFTTSTDGDELIYRPVNLIPHVVTILAIATTENDVAVVYAKWPTSEIPLKTVLRYYYSNVPTGDIQTLNFLSKSLTDLYSLLYARGVVPTFLTDDFLCDSSLWILYDVINPLQRILETDSVKEIRLENATTNWIQRKWSNYEYLIYLNKIAGRIRGEVHNHPVFPWVCDFTAENGGWRPLNRTKFRLAKGDDQLREMYSRQPSHHVAELLSDIGYMVYRARVETKEALCKHVRSKWVPREYPAGLVRMYEWTPDECIPELYEDAKLIISRHEDMSDLEIPPFCKTPDDFIRWHRKMLESDEVSSQLHRWIDLTFGYLLSGDDASKFLNVHLCFVEKKGRKLRTNGVVQLFDRPHPPRMAANYNPNDDFFCEMLNSTGNCVRVAKADDDPTEESCNERENDKQESMTQIYHMLKIVRRSKNEQYFHSMTSLLRIIAQIATAEHLHGEFDDKANIERCIRHHPYSILLNYRNLFELLLNEEQDFPDPDEFAFFVNLKLNIPAEVLFYALNISVSRFHDEFGKFSGYNYLRNSVVVARNSKRSQSILLREVEALKTALKNCGKMEKCVVAAFQKLLENEESSIQAVHRLMPAICRCLSEESLKELINPLIDLIQCETSVKLLDRRFLLAVSISYGTQMFLELFLPPIVEALASNQVDRSIVAKDSIMWLSKRYGPVICARFITSDLLRIFAICYDGLKVVGDDQEPQTVFQLDLCGDEQSSRVEAALLEIAASYSVTFVTVQYLPYCMDLIDQYSRRTSPQLEAALVSVFRIARLSIKTMTDHQLMNSIEELIINNIIHRSLTLLLNSETQVSFNRIRNIIICKAISLLHFASQRIGAENARIYAKLPFELLFTTFAAIYNTDDELHVSEKKRPEQDTVYAVPLWVVQEVIDRFAAEWGAPFLSSFCPEPSFLVPFISNSLSKNSPSPITLATYAINSMPSGNRIYSLSSSSPAQSSGISSCESGSLSAVWCARVSAAVCGMRKALRFDHLSLCSFTGHLSTVKRIVAISNENSFVSASTDKTVKLWSVKPDQDAVECQWTYRNHNKALNDVIILSDNTIASTDGVVHLWDPFRSTVLAQLEWENDGNIIGLQPVDRHTFAAISSLHSIVKIFDTRVGKWTSELKLSPVNGVTRSIACRDSGHKMSVALSNGTIVVLDGRTGKIGSLAHGNPTHINGMFWLSSNELLTCDADEVGVVMNVRPRVQPVRRLADSVVAAGVQGDLLSTIQANSMLRIYVGNDLAIETKMRSEELPGTPTAILPLSLNSTFLLGSSQGAIRLMC